VRGDVSSQFLTALLMACRWWHAHNIVIEVVGELISKPYIEITLNLLARFGMCRCKRDGWQRFTIPAGSQLPSPGEIHVEADASSASYFIALGAIATRAGGLRAASRIQGVGADSIQGDIRFIEALAGHGRRDRKRPQLAADFARAWPLKAIELDCNHIPDAAMTLAVMALYADGTTTLRNIASWRVKETDRIAAMACELRKLGATVDEGADFILVTPPAAAKDWRAAASTPTTTTAWPCVFRWPPSIRPGLPVRIEDPKCVAKTFPDYFEALFRSGTRRPGQDSGDLRGRPHRIGQGHAGRVLARPPGLPLPGFRCAVPHHRPGRHCGPDLAWMPPVKMPLRPWPNACRCALRAACAAGWQRCQRRDPHRRSGHERLRVSALPRAHAWSRCNTAFASLPGLVADGRDMGTVIFPDAALKVFLTASAARSGRARHKQLISKGFSRYTRHLFARTWRRATRDTVPQRCPLKPAKMPCCWTTRI
jgi:3-phosphoshikimate 1-carboxyvinyltransferase